MNQNVRPSNQRLPERVTDVKNLFYVFNTVTQTYSVVGVPFQGTSCILADHIPFRWIAQLLCGAPEMLEALKSVQHNQAEPEDIESALCRAEGRRKPRTEDN